VVSPSASRTGTKTGCTTSSITRSSRWTTTEVTSLQRDRPLLLFRIWSQATRPPCARAFVVSLPNLARVSSLEMEGVTPWSTPQEISTKFPDLRSPLPKNWELEILEKSGRVSKFLYFNPKCVMN